MTKHLRTLWSGWSAWKAWQAIGWTLAAGLALLPGTLCAQNGRFTCATMNVDGLPPSITVNYLLGSSTIEINPDGRAEAGATAIAQKVLEQSWDFLAVNEDFNYHTELMAPLTPAGYVAYTHKGGMSVGEAGGMATAVYNYVAGNPLVSADGLNILCRKVPDAGIPKTYASEEEIVKWNDHYGYTDHDNDGMTTKGFRYYHVTIGPHSHPCDLDVYVLHADAGSGWQDGDDGDIAAREKQMAQLLEHIRQKISTRPLLIMGDFNCYYTRDRLKELFIDRIEAIGGGQLQVSDCWVETTLGGSYPPCSIAANGYEAKNGEVLDKILYVNNAASPVQLVLEQCTVGTDFVDGDGQPLSDHYPVSAQFAWYSQTPTVETLAHSVRDVQLRRARPQDVTAEVQRVLGKQTGF